VTVSATDSAGNTASATGTVQIDTVLNVGIDTSGVEGDGVVNATEHADGVTLSGTADAGAQDGSWSADYATGEFTTGEETIPVTVSTADSAGNSAVASSTVVVDTFVNELENVGVVEGNDVVNINEASDGIVLRGTVEQGSTVSVEFEGTTRSATVDADGNWSVAFTADEVPTGDPYETTVQINATDAAGNVLGITDTFMVDVQAPDAADIESVTTADTVTRGFSMLNVEDGTAVDVNEFVNGSSAASSDVEGGSFVNPLNEELVHEALSDNDNSLIVHGGTDDALTLDGTATQTGTQTINGQSYDVYSVGDAGGELIVSQDIDFNQSSVI